MTFDAEKQQIPAAEFAPPTGQVSIGDAETEGTSTSLPRADHVHAFPAAAAGAGATTSLPGDAEGDGVDTTAARSDHRHGREPASGAAALNPNPPVAGTVYQNGLTVPIAITVGVTVTPSSTAAATVSAGIGAANPPTLEQLASVAAAGTVTQFPVTVIVPPGWYWQLAATSPGAAAVIGTAQAVTL